MVIPARQDAVLLRRMITTALPIDNRPLSFFMSTMFIKGLYSKIVNISGFDIR